MTGKVKTRDLLLAATAGTALFLAISRQRRRFDFRGASVVVTGGSRGLGLELARLFAAEGSRITLLARSGEELARARHELVGRGAEVLVQPCDIRDRAQVEKAVKTIIQTYGHLDVLVNNAGVIQVGPFENMAWEDFEQAMAVHAWGPLHLIRAALPHLKQRGGGRIVNISSIGGLVAVPHLLPYVMSKFALTGLSDGLRAELAKDDILVTTVAPGLMRTGSHVNALSKGQHAKEFAWFAVSDALPLLSINVQRAARRIVDACRYGKPRLIITPQAKILHAADALLPGLTSGALKFAARLLPRPVETGRQPRQTGWESRSALAPSLLTRLADRMVKRQNEGAAVG